MPGLRFCVPGRDPGNGVMTPAAGGAEKPDMLPVTGTEHCTDQRRISSYAEDDAICLSEECENEKTD